MADKQPSVTGFPVAETLAHGRFTITERISGDLVRGRYRALDHERADARSLVALCPPQTRSYLDLQRRLQLDIAGITPLRFVGPLHAVAPRSDLSALVEEEPEGWPSDTRTFSVREAIRVARAVGSVVLPLHRDGIALATLRPELVYVQPQSAVALAPRCEAFFATASSVSVRVASPFDRIYMAPEALSADSAQPPADVFSLSAMLAFWISGESPFAGRDVSEQVVALIGNVRRPVANPMPVWTLIDRGLLPAPAARPSLSTFLDELGRLELECSE